MNYNIGKLELEELTILVRKGKGVFEMRDLKDLLCNYTFKIDKQKELLAAFRELDHDGDGYIPKNVLGDFLMKMGEPLEQEELSFLFEEAAIKPDEEEDALCPPDHINIERLSRIMVPSDDIMDDLLREAADDLQKR